MSREKTIISDSDISNVLDQFDKQLSEAEQLLSKVRENIGTMRSNPQFLTGKDDARKQEDFTLNQQILREAGTETVELKTEFNEGFGAGVAHGSGSGPRAGG